MNTLAPHEKRDLTKLEARIFKGLRDFIDVGKALAEIQARKLYRGTHETFARYCEERWHFSRQHGYRLIEAAQVAQNLSPAGDILPTSERQMRPLVGQSPEVVKAAWEAATAANDEPTEEDVREALESLAPEKQVERIQRAEAKAERDIRRDRLNGILGDLAVIANSINRAKKKVDGEPDIDADAWQSEVVALIQAGIDRGRQLVKAAG